MLTLRDIETHKRDIQDLDVYGRETEDEMLVRFAETFGGDGDNYSPNWRLE